MKLSGISLESMEPAIEKIAGLTQAQRIQICVLAVVILTGIFGYFFYYPQYTQLDTMTVQLKQLDQQLATARTAAAQIGKFRQEMKAAEEDFRISRNALPDKEEIPLLLTSVSQFGHDAGLEFILFEPKPEILRDFYAEIPVSITVTGNYHHVGMFFDKVSNLHRIVNIMDIKMVPPGRDIRGGALPANDSGRLITSCTAVTYKFVEAPAGSEKKDAAKGTQKPSEKK
jgi:type IV pilus assembly protein PilO